MENSRNNAKYSLLHLQARMTKRKRPSLVQIMGQMRQASPRSKAGAKWLSKVKKGQVAPKGLISAHELLYIGYF